MQKSSSLLGRTVTVVLALCFFLVFSSALSFAGNTTPQLNNGKKWRIAYYQGGPIPFYSHVQKEIIKKLMGYGWIEGGNLPEDGMTMEPPFWDWLCNTAKSDYLEFLPANGYSAFWNGEKRKEVRTELLKRLRDGEIDLVIAMGTWAGEDLVNESHSVPTLVLSATNFEETGLIKSMYDSGLEHVNVSIDPTFSERQVRMFHRVTDFKKLGVAYEDTPEGRRYSNIAVIDKIAAERGFEVNRCAVLDTTDDRAASRTSCLSCFQELAANSDAIYISALLCADEQIDTLSALFKDEGILSYSFYGSRHVEKGILFGASSDAGYENYGGHNAEQMIQVLRGASPRSLTQVVELPFLLSINTATATAIDFKVPESIRTIARDVYDH